MNQSKYARIAPDVRLGQNVVICDFVNLYGCEIGDNTKIGTFVEIQKNARVGKNVKISSHTFICEGVTIEDDVFVGHNVSFINDKYPRATIGGRLQTDENWEVAPTIVKKGVSIGTSSTILCGIIISENAIIGAGSVVTKDVASNSIVIGNPARPKGVVCVCGHPFNLRDQTPPNRLCKKCGEELKIGFELKGI